LDLSLKSVVHLRLYKPQRHSLGSLHVSLHWDIFSHFITEADLTCETIQKVVDGGVEGLGGSVKLKT
jgi:hypothetical protein